MRTNTFLNSKALLLVLILLGFTTIVIGQINQNDFTFGQYTQNTFDSSLFFKRVIVLNKDSTFSYYSYGKIKDSTSGIFKISSDTVFLNYFDNTNQQFKKLNSINSEFENALMGTITILTGKPLKLLFNKNRLVYITGITQKDAEEKGYYYILNQ